MVMQVNTTQHAMQTGCSNVKPQKSWQQQGGTVCLQDF